MRIFEITAEGLQRHPHDERALVQATGLAQQATIRALKEVRFLRGVIEDERRRKRRRQGSE